jgi:hypothetical protein
MASLLFRDVAGCSSTRSFNRCTSPAAARYCRSLAPRLAPLPGFSRSAPLDGLSRSCGTNPCRNVLPASASPSQRGAAGAVPAGRQLELVVPGAVVGVPAAAAPQPRAFAAQRPPGGGIAVFRTACTCSPGSSVIGGAGRGRRRAGGIRWSGLSDALLGGACQASGGCPGGDGQAEERQEAGDGDPPGPAGADDGAGELPGAGEFVGLVRPSPRARPAVTRSVTAGRVATSARVSARVTAAAPGRGRVGGEGGGRGRVRGGCRSRAGLPPGTGSIHARLVPA